MIFEFWRKLSSSLQVDACIIVMSADPKDVQADTHVLHPNLKEQLLVAVALGAVTNVIVVVDRMSSVGWLQKAYMDACAEIIKLHSKLSSATFVPIDLLSKANISAPDPRLDWYAGPTLCAAVAAFPSPPRAVAEPLLMLVDDVHPRLGATLLGVRVLRGTVRVGDAIQTAPEGYTSTVLSLEYNYRPIEAAPAGSVVGVMVRGLVRSDVRRGWLLRAPGPSDTTGAVEMMCTVSINQSYYNMTKGYEPTLIAHGGVARVKFVELLSRQDHWTRGTEQNPSRLRLRDVAVVRVKILAPILVKPIREDRHLGAFVLYDGSVVGVGRVDTVTYGRLLRTHVLPPWSPETHCVYPPLFRYAVKAVLMAAAVSGDGTPRHPQAEIWMLPNDVLLLIFALLGDVW
jgi:bifunctional enzyme CysN/CysC